MLNKNLDIFRFENNTPEYYPDYSRDFLLICRAYNCLIANEKFDIDTLIYSIDTSKCNAKLLELLCTKLGFFTKKSFMSTLLRYILHGFLPAVRKKGTKQAIEWVVRLFLKALNLDSVVFINIIKKVEISGEIDHNNSYIVLIGIRSTRVDTTLLEEVLKYILPTGYKIQIIFYVSPENDTISKFALKEKTNILFVEDIINSLVRGNDDIIFDSEIPSSVEYGLIENGEPGEYYLKEAIFQNRDFFLPKLFLHILGAVDTVEIISSSDILIPKNFLTTESNGLTYDVIDSNNNFIMIMLENPTAKYISNYSAEEIDEFIDGIIGQGSILYDVNNSEVIDNNNEVIKTNNVYPVQSEFSTEQINTFTGEVLNG